MNLNKRYILLIVILTVSGLYCLFFFNGYLGLSDGNDYAGLARSILRGEGFGLGHLYPLALYFSTDIPQPDNMWAPAYPVFLALWFLIFGLSDTAILAATIFSVWLLIIAVYVLARRIVGENWAILGAALIGLNQSMLSTALEGSPEPFTGALFLFSVYPLITTKTTAKRICISAILFGLTVLTRYQMAILAIPVLIFLTDKKLRSIMLWMAVMLITLSPWLIRNYVIFGNPVFTLQAYGEFTKGMGHLDYYYYTYRSFTPMSFFYAVANFPYYVLKKFGAGIVFFSWWTAVILNFFGTAPFVFSMIRKKYFNTLQKRFVNFSLISLILLIALSSLDGIHLRHLVNIQGLLVLTLILGFIQIKENLFVFRYRYLKAAAIILLLLPARFPFLEMELINNAQRIEKNKNVYGFIKDETEPDAVIVSDVSDAVWWYCDRPSIWIPVIYSDLKRLVEIRRVDYIYFEDTSKYLGRLENSDLTDFFSNTSIVDGSHLGWGLYKINR